MNFTIDGFWKRKIADQPNVEGELQQGWRAPPDNPRVFKEAPLRHIQELSEPEGADTSIILVSAPGAVGKSTLARRIACETGAIYIDLVEALPVGANTLVGGLAKSDTYQNWQAGETVVLIDGLDEARLKVTQGAYEAFLSDVAEASRGREVPTVLFGRSKAIDDAWILLNDEEVTISVLEIGYYDPKSAFDFALKYLDGVEEPDGHYEPRKKAIELLLNRLRSDVNDDGDKFAGYAPVLETVAKRVINEPNPKLLMNEIQQGDQTVTPRAIIDSILKREQVKLTANLTFDDSKLNSRLYTPAEQLSRLAAEIYGTEAPEIPNMSASDREKYSDALRTFVPDHPFLGTKSSVFDAIIVASALNSQGTESLALEKAICEVSINPFLSSFYFDIVANNKTSDVPPEHIGVIYASIRAGLSLGETASLLIERDEDEMHSEVEIIVTRSDQEKPLTRIFKTHQLGTIRLGARVDDVNIVAPLATVEIGGTQEAVLVPPINIQCDKLKFSTNRLVVERQARVGDTDTDTDIVYLEAKDAETMGITSKPLINNKSKFFVTWRGSEAFPWNEYSTTPKFIDDPNTDEALQRFRRFVIVFRSHVTGGLKRYVGKINDARMTKGSGKLVFRHMLNQEIVRKTGKTYLLDPAVLGDKTKMSFTTSYSCQFSDEAIQFVRDALAQGNR